MLKLIQDLFEWAPLGIPAFLFVITFVVFFHELGHFLVARACGVAVETFSIGLGGEIVGWTDRKGTRWKIAWLPIGGYVKFMGDDNAASMPDSERVARMSEAEKIRAFPLKPVWQRMLVVAAGPTANFVLAFLVFVVLFATAGAKGLSTYVGSVQKNSPAAAAGILPGDKITAIDGHPVRLFYGEMQDLIQTRMGKPTVLAIERHGRLMAVHLTPSWIDNTDIFGTHLRTPGIGIRPAPETPENTVYIAIPLSRAPLFAAAQCWGVVDSSLTYLWRIVSHRADTSQLGGPIGIAGAAKSAASHGFYDLVLLLAFISVSLGLINLFPVPLLDGGHLLYYGCEAVLGKPLGERAQMVGFKVGFAVLVTLFIFLTWNDLVR